MADRHPDFSNLAACKDMIAVVACLGWEIERNREASLTFCKVCAIKLV